MSNMNPKFWLYFFLIFGIFGSAHAQKHAISLQAKESLRIAGSLEKLAENLWTGGVLTYSFQLKNAFHAVASWTYQQSEGKSAASLLPLKLIHQSFAVGGILWWFERTQWRFGVQAKGSYESLSEKYYPFEGAPALRSVLHGWGAKASILASRNLGRRFFIPLECGLDYSNFEGPLERLPTARLYLSMGIGYRP